MSTRTAWAEEPVLFRSPQHVFVYGSLKKGFGNHPILSDVAKAFFCGTYLTKVASWEMRSYGGFPCVTTKMKGGKKILGELYLCTPDLIEQLDNLEGHPHWYKRKRVLMDDGTWAFMYVLPDDSAKDLPIVDTSDCSQNGEVYNWQKGVGSGETI